jgi:hypothetical protein
MNYETWIKVRDGIFLGAAGGLMVSSFGLKIAIIVIALVVYLKK